MREQRNTSSALYPTSDGSTMREEYEYFLATDESLRLVDKDVYIEARVVMTS